jgi:toxin ParE1/3/4
VPSYRLTEAAAGDVRAISRHSIKQWGVERAEAYVAGLHRAFETLAALPDSGRDVGRLRAGYRRFEYERHSIYYRKTDPGILEVRVLHQRMMPGKHL